MPAKKKTTSKKTATRRARRPKVEAATVDSDSTETLAQDIVSRVRGRAVAREPAQPAPEVEPEVPAPPAADPEPVAPATDEVEKLDTPTPVAEPEPVPAELEVPAEPDTLTESETRSVAENTLHVPSTRGYRAPRSDKSRYAIPGR
jgi:hypothetical protein